MPFRIYKLDRVTCNNSISHLGRSSIQCEDLSGQIKSYPSSKEVTLEVFPSWKRHQIELATLRQKIEAFRHRLDYLTTSPRGYRSKKYFWLVNDIMGWAQQGLVPGKRQYNNENSHSSITGLHSEKKGEDDEDHMRSQFNKRSRDTSPQRKPLGCMDMATESHNISSKKTEPLGIQDIHLKKEDNDQITSSLSESIDSSSYTSDSSYTTSFEDTINPCLILNRTHPKETCSLQLLHKDEAKRGDIIPFTLPSIPVTCKSKAASKTSKIGLPIAPRRMNTSVNKGTPTWRTVRLQRLNTARSSAGDLVETVEDDSSSSEFSTDDVDTDDTSETRDSNEKDTESSIETDSSESVDVIPTSSSPTRIIPGIRYSLFPYVPPFINFCQHEEQCECLPLEIRNLLKWRLSTITPIVVRKTVTSTGFRAMKKTVEWTGHWGKHMKAVMFRAALKDYQKLNHLPATFQIGRKDKLWRNYQRYSCKFGKENFGFLPKSYILPQEMKSLKMAWDASKGKPWIIKPPAGARGNGIRVINKWGQIPTKRPTIVQKYICKPFLINSRKFDIRIYVLVTSFHPLKIYLYREGLVRFAPVKYSLDSKRVSDRYMHLTNYSINKHCDLYTQNDDAESLEGHKWTLTSLWRYLRVEHDVDALWHSMEDIVIKTLICAEDPISASAFHLPTRYNGYELFGFDIILDENLKPWLLEVNISPSLHSSSPLDLAVKGPLIKEVFNIAGYHFPDFISNSLKKKFIETIKSPTVKLETPVFDKRLYSTILSADEKLKQSVMKQSSNCREQYLSKILETLTPDDIRHLIESEDEFSQCDGFNRIFPSLISHEYLQFLEGPRYYNQLLDAWEHKYKKDRAKGIRMLQALCESKHHLQCVPTKSTTLDNDDNVVSKVEDNTSWRSDAVSSISSEDPSKEDITNGNVVISREVPQSQICASPVNVNCIDDVIIEKTDLYPITNAKNHSHSISTSSPLNESIKSY